MRPATLSSLPADLLEACLAPLDLKERLTQAAEVSKAFYAACHSPELLRTVDVEWRGGVLPKAHSLAAWLERHGQHVRSLRLDARPFPGAAERQEVSHTLHSCLACCGQLQQLAFKPADLLSDADWALPLQSLQHAAFSQGGNRAGADFPPGLQTLTSLSSMRLKRFDISATDRLPPSLTKLVAYLVEVEHVQPHHVAALCQLRHLRLIACGFDDKGAFLSRLAHLSRLDVWSMEPLPSSIASLRTLRHLEVCFWDRYCDFSWGEVEEALGEMQQLTALQLQTNSPIEPPATLTSLSRLQRLRFLSEREEEDSEEEEDLETRALPPGDWVHNLRWLETHWGILARSHAVLSQAQRLETCRVLGPPDIDATSAEEWLSFWGWAAAHPLLRHLHFEEANGDGLSTIAPLNALFNATLALLHQRPMLKVTRDHVLAYGLHAFTNDDGDAADWTDHLI